MEQPACLTVTQLKIAVTSSSIRQMSSMVDQAATVYMYFNLYIIHLSICTISCTCVCVCCVHVCVYDIGGSVHDDPTVLKILSS